MNLKTILVLSLVTVWVKGFSQSSIQGRINDADSNGIPFANVLLLNQSDSLLVKGAVTDESGNFFLTDIMAGLYYIESSMVGFSKSYSPIINLSKAGKVTIKPIILVEDLNELEEVTVKAVKPLYEMQQGKLVINVQSSITSAGLTAIDILERSPGVFVNRSNNSFSLGGRDGVIVLMNGKRSHMPMEALYQMLAGLNAGDIQKIEIMTVPPANYDADGDAGFVDIVMKRSSDLVGTNATLSTGMGYGSGPQVNFSLNLNHQGNKLSWFGIYSLNNIEQFHAWENYRESRNESESVLTSNSADRNTERTVHNYQLGFDYMIKENLTLSGLMSGYSNRFQIIAPTISFLDYSTSPDTLIELTMTERNQWKHMMGNINLHHIFKNGQAINANLDYLTYHNNSPSQYKNGYYLDKGSLVREEENSISNDTPIKIWVAKVDHFLSMGNFIFLESGIKGTFSSLINQVVFKTKKGDSWIGNPAFSNNSDLSENILAAFTSIKIVLDTNTNINAGIRYEHTKTYLETLEEGRVVDRNYGKFFPSLFLSRKLNEDKMVQLSYGRRITRPTFNQMAPWVAFFDPYTFFTGNVNILPTFTHNFKGDYSYKSFLFSLQYSHDKDVIRRFQPHIDPESNMLVFVPDNIDRRKTLAVTVTLPFLVSPWWEMQNNFTANRQKIDTELHGEVYQVTQEGLQLNSTQTFKLPGNYTMELAGNYVSPIINGYFNWLARGFVNLGVQKEFSYGGIFRLSCNDIFETNILRWKTFDEASFSINGRLKEDTRRFVLTYTHNFGNSKVKGTRKRSVGSQEEQNRVTN